MEESNAEVRRERDTKNETQGRVLQVYSAVRCHALVVLPPLFGCALHDGVMAKSSSFLQRCLFFILYVCRDRCNGCDSVQRQIFMSSTSRVRGRIFLVLYHCTQCVGGAAVSNSLAVGHRLVFLMYTLS